MHPKSPEKNLQPFTKLGNFDHWNPPRKVGLCQDLWDAQTWGDDTSQRYISMIQWVFTGSLKAQRMPFFVITIPSQAET